MKAFVGFTGVLITGLLFISVCQAENSIALYFGKSFSRPDNVRLKTAEGDNLTFEGVSWTDESFVSPVYYGIRLTHWSERYAPYGIAVDFTHAKMYANMAQVVEVKGDRGGQVVATTEPLGQTFDRLAMSHGYNFLTLNALLKPAIENSIYLKPYIGAGVGLAIPHFEAKVGTSKIDDFILAGPVLQGLVGMRFGDSPFMAEYKFSYGRIKAELPQGSEIRLQPTTHHIVGGIVY